MVHSALEIFPFIGIALGVGLVSLLTPCVFPMIPITISYFLNRKESSNYRPLKDAFIYVTGIVLTFSLIGLLTSLIFGSAGIHRFAVNPWVNLFIACIFILFALNLFGFFEIKISPRVIDKIQKMDRFFRRKNSLQNDRISILSMSVIFTITTFTCTMPFIGTILVSASRENFLYPFIGMFFFGISFAFPFFILALFPALLDKIPKTGNWIYKIKVLMGFLELAASIKFLSNSDMVWQNNIITRDIFLMIWAFISFLIAIYFLDWIKFPVDIQGNLHQKKNEKQKQLSGLLIRMTFSFLFMFLTAHFLFSLGGRPLKELGAFLPPVGYGKVEKSKHEKFNWLDDLQQAKEIFKDDPKPIFIDFTGYTCVNCRWMEQNIFNKPIVENLLQKFLLVRLYTDGEGEIYEKNQRYQQEKFNTLVLPLYAIMDSNDRVIKIFKGMTREEQEFISFLENSFQQFKSHMK